MTNGEAIRSMTNEQLAEFLIDFSFGCIICDPLACDNEPVACGLCIEGKLAEEGEVVEWLSKH